MKNISEQLMRSVAHAMDEKKGHDVSVLSLEGISLIADYFIICHGNSDIQVQSIANEVKKTAEQQDVLVRRIEGFDAARWVLIDLGDVVAHIFHRDEREYYNLERLWSDAKVVEPV